MGLTAILSVISSVTTLFNKLIPDKNKQAEFALEVEKLKAEALMTQMEVNKAEAANPNRKWVTFRELFGYVLVAAVAWQWVGAPVVSYIFLMFGHPLDTNSLPKFETLDMVYILCTMLGVDAVPIITNKFRGSRK